MDNNVAMQAIRLKIDQTIVSEAFPISIMEVHQQHYPNFSKMIQKP